MIDVQQLTFAYQKQPPLFEDLSFSIQPGSITGLLGKNGAGKTSLLKLITGLLYPTGGRIRAFEHQPEKRKPSYLQELFFVPEEFALPPISIKKFIKFHHTSYPTFDKLLMDKLLDEFELSAEKNLHKLSYGQKKKFLISFALATKCRLLVLDEPTNGLDIPSKSIFRQVMAGNLDDDQLALISTHQVKDVENLIDRLVILDGGKVVMQKDMLEISTKLKFAVNHHPGGDNVLYSEMVPEGYKVITPQVNGGSHVDIELLFNAVVKGTKLLNEHED